MKYVNGVSGIVLMCALFSFAGIDVRIGGGLNISDEAYRGDYAFSAYIDPNRHVGFNCGVTASLPISQQMGIVTGLQYETRGSGWKVDKTKLSENDDVTAMTADFSLNYLQIPVLFSYRPLPALSVALGPELGIFLFGKKTLDDKTYNLYSKHNSKYINRIDFGASLCVDYTFVTMINVGVGYYQGFLNNDGSPPEGNFNGGIYNSNIKLFVAYILHL